MISRLQIDEWEDGRNVGQVIDSPTAEEIMASVRALDGQKCDSLMIEIDRDRFMAIGGGQEGRYVLSIVDGKETFNAAGFKPEAESDGEALLRIGGQSVPIPLEAIVDLDTVLKAVQHYVEQNAAHPDLHWERE